MTRVWSTASVAIRGVGVHVISIQVAVVVCPGANGVEERLAVSIAGEPPQEINPGRYDDRRPRTMLFPMTTAQQGFRLASQQREAIEVGSGTRCADHEKAANGGAPSVREPR